MKPILKSGIALVSLAAFAGSLCSCNPKSIQAETTEGSEVGYSLSLFSNLLSVQPSTDNVTVSPYSAGVALSMLAEGAEGKSLEELDKALNGCRLQAEPLSSNDSVIVKSANSLWTNKNYPVRKSYVEILDEKYDAVASSLDFSSSSSVGRINAWARENTAGKIDNVVEELGPDMVAVLANAVYFKGAWQTPFKSRDTRIRTFYGASGESQVSFMTGTNVYEYAEYQGNQMIRIPYCGGQYAMTVLLPSKGADLSRFEGLICESFLDKALAALEPVRVRLHLPKFKVEGELSLVPVLEKMGVNEVFTSKASLGGIADGPLSVSEVNQKTFVNVDERGSEAAAVTTIGIRLTAMPPQDFDVKVMDVNRPFYYMISDVESGRILFIGRISVLN